TETEEIRIYGMDSDDQFVVNGKSNNDISLRIIPGKGKDSIKDHSQKGRERIKVYDNEKTGFDLSSNSRLHLSRDTFLNNYQYKHFEYDDKGFVFKPGLTLGFGYHITKHGWRKTPFASEHRWVGYYGPNRGSFAFEYRYIANQLIGKWNLEAIARADFPFVANYYGIGNETAMNTDINRRYYRYRSTKFSGGFDLHRLFDSVHRVSVSGLFQTVKIRPDEDRFIMDDLSEIDPSVFEQNYYARAGVGYQFKKADHPIVPTKGIEFNLAAAYIQNIKQGNKNIADYSSSLSFYLPFLRNFSLAMRVGGETITGNPEFFQLATLSGKENLRGFRRQRYYGKSSFYNNNELRFILNTRNRLFNGKIGLLAFLDQGRVWQPGEESNTWHHGYGGGFFISPFNRILLNASYGISEDDRVLHLRIGFFF
ncbi:MAG TPA: ShlB/FhaC/HecB family hemolysin secretion/activation protein, partial [Chitinophagaceae bacterium]